MSPREKARVADWKSQSATIKPTGALNPPDESARQLREGLFECLIDPFTALLVRVQRQSLQQRGLNMPLMPADKNLTVHPGGLKLGTGMQIRLHVSLANCAKVHRLPSSSSQRSVVDPAIA
jgi:hypothetical protein